MIHHLFLYRLYGFWQSYFWQSDQSLCITCNEAIDAHGWKSTGEVGVAQIFAKIPGLSLQNCQGVPYFGFYWIFINNFFKNLLRGAWRGYFISLLCASMNELDEWFLLRHVTPRHSWWLSRISRSDLISIWTKALKYFSHFLNSVNINGLGMIMRFF